MNMDDLFSFQCRDIGNPHECIKCKRMWTCNAKGKDCDQDYNSPCPNCNNDI